MSWASRLGFAVFGAAYRRAALAERLLSEALVSVQVPGEERRVLDAHYATEKRYRRNQDQGLYPFELRALERFFPEPPARLLVPGSGGGREIAALAGRGYEVHGFEPVELLVEASRLALSNRPRVRIDRASVEQWAERRAEGAAEGGSPAYDGVLGGWGMWSHVLAQRDRRRIFQAFRSACPRGPVLLSFSRDEEVFDELELPYRAPPLYPEPRGRIERLLRGFLRQRVLGLPPVERGTGYRNGFFFHTTSEEELREESAPHYAVAYYERNASLFPHAVLVPRAP